MWKEQSDFNQGDSEEEKLVKVPIKKLTSNWTGAKKHMDEDFFYDRVKYDECWEIMKAISLRKQLQFSIKEVFVKVLEAPPVPHQKKKSKEIKKKNTRVVWWKIDSIVVSLFVDVLVEFEK